MGEYAIRNSDGAEIKIGTCEDMYYLRFDQRNLVRYTPGNIDINRDDIAAQCRFRLPFPDENAVLPGDFDEYNRAQRLYKGNDWFQDESKVSDPGLIQLHHQSGLLLNVPCYHGYKLPEVGPGMKAFWNGKSPSLFLSSLRCVLIGENVTVVMPVVRCVHCDQAWRYSWNEIWDYIPRDMQEPLRKYAAYEEFDMGLRGVSSKTE